jgi:hypothetical protein
VAHLVNAAHPVNTAHPVNVAHLVNAAHPVNTAHPVNAAHAVNTVQTIRESPTANRRYLLQARIGSDAILVGRVGRFVDGLSEVFSNGYQ